ncbi:MAG TPA: L-serine ammonia-lyase [Bacteroidales bacterium]|nr:L-serine ammonia-lyase [Bacteroidales bacterium]
MDSVREIYRIGYGPSSSHTMGPSRAAELFLKSAPQAKKYRVHLYGSLALTGKGHLTDVAITGILYPSEVQFIWHTDEVLPEHPNGMIFEALDSDGKITNELKIFSTGGGQISQHPGKEISRHLYPLHTMHDIMKWCDDNGTQLWEYVVQCEGESILSYLAEVWQVMKSSVQSGIEHEGVLPGPLKLARKAASYHAKSQGFNPAVMRRGMVYTYALAVAEENAGGGRVVTAPTCGSCGIVPAVLYLLHNYNDATEQRIIRALATAGLVGNLVKHNASISGAMVGCQGEVGTACAMAAAAATQIFGGTITEVEYAAEMGMEHHLGLTCDPVMGLVQIPCIERNAFGAARALDASTFAILSDGRHRISFDEIVQTMKQTGLDMNADYRETSTGGLAKVMKNRKKK